MPMFADRIGFATEIPVPHLEQLAYLTDFDFVIGSKCFQHPEYKRFYTESFARTDRYLVIDNGAFEGELLTDEQLLDLTEHFLEVAPDKAVEVVAPDAVGDFDETMRRLDTFLDDLSRRGLSNRVTVQVCPQGGTFRQWRRCYREMAGYPIKCFGITYVIQFEVPSKMGELFLRSLNIAGRREVLLFELLCSGDLDTNIPHHLLGLSSPGSLAWYRRFSFIRSIDTSFPILSAVEGREVKPDTPKPERKLDYRMKLEGRELRLAAENILKLREMCCLEAPRCSGEGDV